MASISRLFRRGPKLRVELQYQYQEYRWPYPKYWSVRLGPVFIGIVKQEGATTGYKAYADAVGQIGEELATLDEATELLRSDYATAVSNAEDARRAAREAVRGPRRR